MIIKKLDPSIHILAGVKSLLAMAAGRNDPEVLDRLLKEYIESDNRTLYIALDEGRVSGIVGAQTEKHLRAVIIHLAVHPDFRLTGVGRHLIQHLFDSLSLNEIEAETDQDAVSFYRACGFSIIEISSRYPGIHRFRCTRSRQVC